MSFRIAGKNFDLGKALRQHISERIESLCSRYLHGSVTGHAVLDHEGSGYRTDCTLHLRSGVTLHAEGYAQDSYASFDEAASRLERRLTRYKRRIQDHHGIGVSNGTAQVAGELFADYVIQGPVDEQSEAGFHPVVVAERKSLLNSMPVSEAVMELDFTGAHVQVFRHAATGRINMVYRRTDGNIGWIDLDAQDRASGDVAP
ncbi:MAG: hypothetical protein RI997_920 [Pseudomonadota bacterium]|jgi:ribosomal subunit interface protein